MEEKDHHLNKMNKKGVGVIGAVMLFIVFLVIWFVFLGGWVAQVGAMVVSENGLTGIEAFFFNNLNLVVMVCMFLGMLGWMYIGGQR